MEVPTDMNEYTRVLKLASTPSKSEFLQVALISAAGVGLIGFLGFVVYVVMSFLPS